MKSIEEIREALARRVCHMHSDDYAIQLSIDRENKADFEIVSAALDELAALRLEVSALKYGIGERDYSFSPDDNFFDPLMIHDAEGQNICRAVDVDTRTALLTILNQDAGELRAENVRLREAIKKRGETGHVGVCSYMSDRATCICGATEWNALVRSVQ